MKQLGFGIIGLGVIAEVHAQVLKQIEGCKLVAGLDTVEARAEEFAKAQIGRASCRERV